MWLNNKARILLLLVAVVLAAPLRSWAVARPRVIHAVDVQIRSPPIPVTIGGKPHLAYELHITNFRPTDVTLTRVEVLDANRGTRLGDFSGVELNNRLGRPGAAQNVADKRVIGAGMRAVFYVWLALDEGIAIPSKLRHKIALDVIRGSNPEPAIVDTGTSCRRRWPSSTLLPSKTRHPHGFLIVLRDSNDE